MNKYLVFFYRKYTVFQIYIKKTESVSTGPIGAMGLEAEVGIANFLLSPLIANLLIYFGVR
jgi:hypothetical protein